ncbi:hypothetical protein EPD60_08285 [Flaviaesturariibacter flavus]|uniref:Uncharacterized protein n=1 Tax=Flaviaesturariibacter flavus TaxID=2502780 RepID=A0A4R1BAM3_9BACT|nr:DUF6252 family protein [Flaviaesturariibacter flavus]TCJ14003.1 hypothetical protein EPD60_08285 [Flaviaesturariibacter flavus]
MKNLFAMAAATLLLASCSKKVSELPAATDSGENTFGASVNGTLWAPRKSVMPSAPPVEASFAGGDDYVIHARDLGSTPRETEFEIFLKDITRPGTYVLNANTAKMPNHSGAYAYYVERNMTPKYEYITSSTNTGSVNITRVDKANHILAGTFSFTAKEINGKTDPINVTEGRFDVQIQ